MPQNSITPKKEQQYKYNVRCKNFGDVQKITCFNRPIFNPHRVGLDDKTEYDIEQERDCREMNAHIRAYERKQKEIDYRENGMDYKPRDRSLRTDSLKRARDKVYEICKANEFEYFITFTLDRSKIDRYDPKEILKKLNVWLSNGVSRKAFQYVLLPEYHKDKAIHFHGMFNGDLALVDSGKVTESGQPIYNADAWSYGFSTVIRFYGTKERCINYVLKYRTTRGMLKNPLY